MIWVVAALFLLSLVNYLIKRLFRAKSDFWVLVRKYPDLAQAWFETSDCWRIFYSEPAGGYAHIVPADEWAGPFSIAARNKDTGQLTRAVVFGRHHDIALSQATFPHAISLAIGHYPKPRTSALNLIFVILTGGWLAALLLGASNQDRWVIRDGAVACSEEEESRNIQTASSASSRRRRTELAVEDKTCSVLLANERVQIIELSADGFSALVHTQKHTKPQWMITSDLRKTNPGWIALLWLSSGQREFGQRQQDEDTANLAFDKQVLSRPRSDPTPRLNKAGRCIDWEHAHRHGYVDTCWASSTGGSR